MSGQTINQSATRIEALQLQSSAYGVTLALAYGRCRIPGNLLWYGGFKAVPHTQTQSGKGGGVKVQNTTYTYQASVMMGLCEGPVLEVPRIWRGKNLYSGGYAPEQLLSIRETFGVPESLTYTLAHTALGRVTGRLPDADPSRGGSRLDEGIHFAVDASTVTFLPGLVGQRVQLSYQYAVGGQPQTAMQALGLSLLSGQVGQPVWSYLTTHAPAQAIPYSGIALVAGQDYDLGTGAQVENHTFEVIAPQAYTVAPTVPDADPADFTADVLCNARYGALFPSEHLASLDGWSDYCRAAGLLMSPALTEQMSAAKFIDTACRLTNSWPVWSDGVLKIRPLGDTPLTANGRTYTPDTTPVYDLTDDDFLVTGPDDEPVRITRRGQADVHNHVRLEWRNRANQYSLEIAEAKDRAHIQTYGQRSAEIVQAHWICDADTARTVVQLLLQRSIAVRSEYRFTLPWTKALLERGDLVTLTDGADLDRLPVRITAVSERPDGELDVQAEDFPFGAATAAKYANASGQGYAANYNVPPDGTDAPVIFEAPADLTSTGIEVYAAVRGSGPNWGGCRVWVSLDGTRYRKTGVVYGGARYGRLSTPVGTTAGVQGLGTSQLLNASPSDAQALQTLCYVGGSTPEYLAYTTATLTGAGAYTLAGLQRGAYGTPLSTHAAGDAFVRVDDGLAKSGPLDLAFIGKTLFMKFTSFNLYGGAEQSLADVQAYPYLVTGTMAKLPPSAPAGLSFTLQPFGVQLACQKNPEPDVVAYQWRAGASWATGQVLEAAGGTSYPWAVQAAGSYTAWVAAIDGLGNFSPPSAIAVTIAAPTMASLGASFAGGELVLAYRGTAGAFALAGYEIRVGDQFTTAQVVSFQQVTRWTRTVDWGGPRRWWVVPVDVKGNYGTPASTDTTVASPGAVAQARAEVVDNNVLLYWAQPATGTLPVDRYEVRKGASWAAGTLVGSNGNSTFAAVFEQLGGSYSYWVAAYDTANNLGTPAPINATVAQPPDYLLRADYNDDFTGTCSGCYVENGRVVGPSLGETLQTHFEGRGWASIDAQIAAGFPLVFQPGGTAGSYEQVLDYGTPLPSTTITVTPTVVQLAGAVAIGLQVSYKANAADPWIDAPANQAQALASGFRYIKVRVSFTASGGDDLAELAGLNIKLASKLKTDSGAGTAAAGDAGGTPVAFSMGFIDVASINVTPSGTAARYALYDFVDAPNPTGFRVLLFDNNGNRVSGAFSWTARGY